MVHAAAARAQASSRFGWVVDLACDVTHTHTLLDDYYDDSKKQEKAFRHFVDEKLTQLATRSTDHSIRSRVVVE